LQRLNSLETYYHILNIIGFRLTQFPNATVELVGTNTNKGLERNNTELSQARAENVKRYLTEIWKIEPRRIKTTARNLPKEPTKPTEESGDEENRRVEIYSSDSRIIEPILSMDTVSVLRNEKIVFKPTVESSFGIKNWNLEVKTADSIIKIFRSEENLPSEIIWETTNINLLNNMRDSLKYQLTVSDKVGNARQSREKNILIDRITVESKRVENSTDMEYEYYSLILFEFASRNLDAKHNTVIDFIRSRIRPNSKIIISGYTDVIGNEEVNRRIATERARAAARRLRFDNVEIRGIGKDELLYDNTFPEGRFYCRTVTIYIETPVMSD
jgi:outer membrane protein OmpA-like peptidoglycan-associated protein